MPRLLLIFALTIWVPVVRLRCQANADERKPILGEGAYYAEQPQRVGPLRVVEGGPPESPPDDDGDIIRDVTGPNGARRETTVAACECGRAQLSSAGSLFAVLCPVCMAVGFRMGAKRGI